MKLVFVLRWRRAARWAVVALVAAAALALLGLLYDRSQAADPQARAVVQDDLRQVHQNDSDWNVEVMSAKVGLADSYDALVAPLARIAVLQKRIEHTQAEQGGPVSAEVRALREAFMRKADLVDHFKSHNAILRNSMRYLPAAAQEARDALAQLRGADAARSHEVAALVGVALEEAARFAVIPETAQEERLAQVLAQLDERLQPWPEQLPARMAAANFANHARTVLRQVAAEGELLGGVLRVPTVTAIANTNARYEAFFAERSLEAERWRQALVGYSAILLLVVASIGWRLRLSYRQIRTMNAALVEANDLLEHRVRERTRELADALASLHESEAQLIQSEKMSSLGQMVAGVAHEINTPLAYVRSSLETVGEQLADVQDLVHHSRGLLDALDAPAPDPAALTLHHGALTTLTAGFEELAIVPELRALTRDGLHGLDQISEIVLNLKDFSRLDRSKTTRFDLREGLESTLTIARGTLKGHRVVKRYGSVPLVECAPSQLNQVFLNLISNAAQAIAHDDGVITISTACDGDTVRVDVQDNGAGIAPEHLGRIFDPFFTTKAIGEGTGLGLAICYKIVQEHGGRIDVTSILGVGTTFSVRLPGCGVAPAANAEADTLVLEAVA